MAFSNDGPHWCEQDQLAPIENLHDDAMLAIISQILDIESLMSLIKASPKAYRVFSEYRGVICQDFLRELGPFVPIALARFEASTAEWRPKRPLTWTPDQADEYSIKLGHFCDTYLCDQATKRVPASHFTLEATLKMFAFHRCVLDWARAVCLRLVQEPPESEFRYSNKPHERQASEQERYRVIKMLYVTELISILLPQKHSPSGNRRDPDWERFWKCFAPWEHCQYVEMQTIVFELLRSFKPFKYGLPSGKPLADLLQWMKRPDSSTQWTHFYEVLALQAGLEALEPAVKAYLIERDPPKAQPPSKLFKIVEDLVDHPEMRIQWCRRYINQWRWKMAGDEMHQIYPEYKNIWLKPTTIPSGDSVAYSFDTAHIEEKYVDSDDGPLTCWLFDIIRYQDHEPDKFALRQDISYVMTCFWDRSRWEMITDSALPSIAELKKYASTRALIDRDRVVPMANLE